jgi:2,4-dienoyl-CoA reductase-like NADH-dependent reductase (Old Yellow Enzyme family)
MNKPSTAAAGLFSPIQIGALELCNRIVVSPMDQYQAIDGSMGDWHLMHLGQFAKSGAGLVLTEAMHVEPEGRITPACAGLYCDDNERALARVLAFCHGNGFARLGVQIVHAGRKASAQVPYVARNTPLSTAEGGWRSWSCAGQAYGPGWPDAQALDDRAMARITDAHAQAARRAARAGADLLELVMAHGYLLHEFLSPLSNLREDDFGGSFNKRIRYPLQVFDAVRAAWPADKPLGVRLSVEDHLPGGWNAEQCAELAQQLKARGCDYLCASSGGLSLAQKAQISEGHQVHYARALREATELPCMTVGMIQDPLHAERIVAEGSADLVSLARAFLHDPHWPWHAAAVLGGDVPYPQAYVRAYRSRWHRTMRAGRRPIEAQQMSTPYGSTSKPIEHTDKD